MKKVLLTAIALFTIASASVFGMYGDRDSWIDFLTDANQFRARMDQLGFVLGNGTIKGTFGLRSQAAGTYLGNILKTDTTGEVDLTTTISVGIGYTSEPFGIGVGYSYTYLHERLGVHTPVLMINALNNNLRITIPVQIAVTDDPFNEASYPYGTIYNENYIGISTDTQIRYYTGIDAFNQIRLYFKYGQGEYENLENSEKYTVQSVGFEARFYFLNTPIGNITINPFIKVAYNTSLKGQMYNDDHNNHINHFRAGEVHNATFKSQNFEFIKIPYDVTAQIVLSLTANSDIVSLYVEPSLGYKAVYDGKYRMFQIINVESEIIHSLAWGAYTELYIRPTQDLEWYFEMDVNNNSDTETINPYNGVPVDFAATTGITWYLPALGGAQ